MQESSTKLCLKPKTVPHRDLPALLFLLSGFLSILLLLIVVVVVVFEVQNILDAGVTRADVQLIPVLRVA